MAQFTGGRRSGVALVATVLALVLTVGCGSQRGRGGSAAAGAPSAVLATLDLTEDKKDNYVSAVAVVGPGALLVGTEHGLYDVALDPAARTLSEPKRVADTVDDGRVNAIRVDGQDVLVASAEGVVLRRNGAWVRHPLGNVNDVLQVDGDLWAATNSGIEVLRAGSSEWHQLEVTSVLADYFPTRKMTSLATDGTSAVFVGTEFGVHHYDLAAYLKLKSAASNFRPGTAKDAQPSGPLWTRWFGAYQNPLGGGMAAEQGNCPLAGGTLKAIRRDAAGKRFLFCTERGVTSFDGKDWTPYMGKGVKFARDGGGEIVQTPEQGNVDLPTSEVYDACPVDGDLLLATRSGLARVKPDRSATLVTMEQGLPSDAVRCLAQDPASGLLVVGTENGLALIKP